MSKKVEMEAPAPVRKITRSEAWFNANVQDNRKEIEEVCEMTGRRIHEQARVILSNPNSTPVLFALVVDRTFTAIANFLVKKQSAGYRSFSILLGRNFNIGYRDGDDDTSEKIGNFVPVLEYGEQNKSIVPSSSAEPEEIAIDSYKRWLELNTVEAADDATLIASEAFDHLLNEDRINLRHKEAIIPIFCIFIDMLVEVLKIKYQEKKDANRTEVLINVFGLFKAYYSIDATDNTEVIEFEPGIKLKQDMKSDKYAGGVNK